MNSKGIIISSLISIISAIMLIWVFTLETSYAEPDFVYQVYLDGEKIGLINSKEKLYELINKEQKEIKEEYNVDQVYPPKGFDIIRTHTYNEELSTIEEVYQKIKEEKQFTIKGYSITIKSNSEGVEPTYIYVLNDDVFNDAAEKVVHTFVTEERYKQYLNNTQPEIVDVGYIINEMYFDEKIIVKEAYISTDQKIYTSTDDLTKYLLFGENISRQEYVVKQGDTIESIAEANKLNTEELLIANDAIDSEDTLLAIGQSLNVALIDPVLSLVYDETIVSDEDIMYSTVTQDDNTLMIGKKKTVQKGEVGIQRVTMSARFINGEQNQGVKIIGTPAILKPAVNEIIAKGTRQPLPTESPGTGSYVDTGETWGWPTNTPYIITSRYGYRWGTIHDGLDISGTGYGSPIYAMLDGEVISAQYGGIAGSSAGYNVVIKHNNGYYTLYAHMSGKPPVSVGQWVSRGKRIGSMGKSGVATGTHVHIGVFYGGRPYNGGKAINPERLWK